MVESMDNFILVEIPMFLKSSLSMAVLCTKVSSHHRPGPETAETCTFAHGAIYLRRTIGDLATGQNPFGGNTLCI